VDGSVIAANRALAARGYTQEEARVEPAEPDGGDQYRLVGTLLVTVEVGPPSHLLRLVSLMPERQVLLESRGQWSPE
jgi:hypothetical protein